MIFSIKTSLTANLPDLSIVKASWAATSVFASQVAVSHTTKHAGAIHYKPDGP